MDVAVVVVVVVAGAASRERKTALVPIHSFIKCVYVMHDDDDH